MLRYSKSTTRLDKEDNIDYLRRVYGSGFRVTQPIHLHDAEDDSLDIDIEVGTYVYIDDYLPYSEERKFSMRVYLLDENGKIKTVNINSDTIPYSELELYFEQDDRTVIFSEAIKTKKKEIEEQSRKAYRGLRRGFPKWVLGLMLLLSIPVGILCGKSAGVLTGVGAGFGVASGIAVLGIAVLGIATTKLVHSPATITTENVNKLDMSVIYDEKMRKYGDKGSPLGIGLLENYIEQHLRLLESLNIQENSMPKQEPEVIHALPKPKQDIASVFGQTGEVNSEMYKTI